LNLHSPTAQKIELGPPHFYMAAGGSEEKEQVERYGAIR